MRFGECYILVFYMLSESGLCDFGKLCQVRILVVCKFSSVCCSLYSCRMLIMVIMGKWSDDSAC